MKRGPLDNRCRPRTSSGVTRCQDNRSRVPLFLQGETKRDKRNAQRELEARFDDDVSLTDLREALVLAGLEHLDEVEGQLEDWGYGMTFDD